jgi:pimeloyl-ACP methyl ester carboxylesterase
MRAQAHSEIPNQGNTEAVRDLGFLEWKNDLSWMEGQQGIRWNRAIKRENEQFNAALAQKSVKGNLKEFTSDLNESLKRVPDDWVFEGWKVVADAFSPSETYSYGKDFKVTAWDADIDKTGTYFAAAAVDPKGFERFSLEVYAFEKGKTPIRISNIKDVSPQVAWLNEAGVVVFLGAYNDLRYDTVYTWNPITKEQKQLYKLTEPTETLELKRAEDGSVYVIASDFVNERVGFVSESGLTWPPNAIANHILVLAHDTWIKNGKTSLGFLENDGYLESISLKAGWAVTRSYGIRTLWQLPNGEMKKPKAMIFIWGEVTYDTREPSKISVLDMRYKPYTVDSNSWTLEKTEQRPFPCSYYNTVSPAFVVNPDPFSKPKGLLIAAYGAYGFPTKVGSLIPRWLPLLKSGWAIASIAIPGSGDHDLAWYRAGQRVHRGDSFKVFADAVKDLQEELGVDPEATALFGRSAGGLLVISAAVNNPGIVGALYVESPYVDILRSISNPKLPLTVIETREFGIGTNPTDVIAAGAWSPMEHIPTKGIPDLFVVARSDQADLEVFPYEVLKFITRIRGEGNGLEKLLYMSENLGHFTTSVKTRAEDLALLDGWLENNLSNSYNTMYGMIKKNKNHKNKTRKNKNHKNKSRKNRK